MPMPCSSVRSQTRYTFRCQVMHSMNKGGPSPSHCVSMRKLSDGTVTCMQVTRIRLQHFFGDRSDNSHACRSNKASQAIVRSWAHCYGTDVPSANLSMSRRRCCAGTLAIIIRKPCLTSRSLLYHWSGKVLDDWVSIGISVRRMLTGDNART